MNYNIMIDPAASKPVTVLPVPLVCPDCGEQEHDASIDEIALLVFVCGRVEAIQSSGEWFVICPCPASLLEAAKLRERAALGQATLARQSAHELGDKLCALQEQMRGMK